MPTIDERLEARRLALLGVKHKAASLYATFDGNERTAVRFGMFPARKMQAAEAELLAEEAAAGAVLSKSEISRELALGVMDAANAGPDRLVV
jgi:hypothetical protein